MSLWDDYEYDYDEDDRPDEIECKRCGKAGLYWVDTSAGWKLASKQGVVHVCDEKRLAKMVAAKFDVEPD